MSGSILLAIVGPTASGKSEMGVEVALRLEELGATVEIVSCDSMAVYRGLDIASDAPGEEDRRGVVHHLVGIADPDDPITAVAYRELARAAIEDIGRRGRIPMLVGGSGLYFRAAVDDLSFAPTDPERRAALEREDPRALYEVLRREDPASAEAIDPRNERRVVRAVEILELTGRPPSELRGEWERFESPYELDVVGLTWEREELDRRMQRRTGSMVEAGLVEEVRAAVEGGLSRTAMQALGVKEVVEHLEGRCSLADAVEATVRNTRRFARRQMSWFRADPRVAWLSVSELGWEACRDRILDRFTARLGLAR